ncbi:MAG: glycosyltransferase family 2 protein [Gemmatimonadales bacterium]
MPPETTLPFVSIILPCRNESPYVAGPIETALNGDYPQDRLEVIAVDGRSTDGTRARLEALAERDPRVRVLDNPERVTPTALNRGIAAARGDVILRMDAHSAYPPSYVRDCVEALQRHNADNVGGRWIIQPLERDLPARAAEVVLTHPLGVGGATYRHGAATPREVDTVPYGCYPRDLFDRIGGFDPHLRRGQDMAFNQRLRRAGGRIVFDPRIVCYYHPRTRLGGFAARAVENGYWAVYPLRFGVTACGPRHLAPGAFVLLLIASLWVPPLAAAGVAWLATVLSLAAHSAWSHRDPGLAFAVPVYFALLHLGYGVGTLAGLLAVIWRPAAWRALAVAFRWR